jgi:hypothetical protein
MLLCPMPLLLVHSAAGRQPKNQEVMSQHKYAVRGRYEYAERLVPSYVTSHDTNKLYAGATNMPNV